MTLVGVRTEVENYDCSGQVNLATTIRCNNGIRKNIHLPSPRNLNGQSIYI